MANKVNFIPLSSAGKTEPKSYDTFPILYSYLVLYGVGMSSISPVSMNRQEILADFGYLGRQDIGSYVNLVGW